MIIKKNEPIINSLKLKSLSKESALISNKADLYFLSEHINKHNLEYLILGEGTNIVPPEFYDGIVIRSDYKNISYKSPDILTVGSAVNWDDLVKFSLENDIKGFENLSLIPGSVGASPIQNIGAYGVEVSSLISSIDCFDIKNSELLKLSNKECNFKYRSSDLKNSSLFIMSINFKIDSNRKLNSRYQSIQNYMNINEIDDASLTAKTLANIVSNIRRSVLPNHHEIFNAGSFFKNPILHKDDIDQKTFALDSLIIWELENNMVKVGAARLIELIRDKISPSENVSLFDKHSLVVITNGKANQSEVLAYAKNIQDIVFDIFNIKLDIEPNIIT